MIAITTSVFYHDELPIVLDRNYHLFKEWYILTSEKDKKTIELCSKYANVTILFFDFYKNGGFNKFGAIKKAQKIAHKEYPNEKYCILDSDIILPEDFIFSVESTDIMDDSIIGCRRFNVSKNCFGEIVPDEYPCVGYLQIYSNTEMFYEDAKDCADGDLHFAEKFHRKFLADKVFCIHLGEHGVHWSGKKENIMNIVKPTVDLRRGRYISGLLSLISYDDRIKGKMLEVGSYLGESTYLFACSEKFTSIHCLDPWESDYDENDQSSKSDMSKIESQFDKFKNSCDGLITKVKDYSDNVDQLYEDEFFDFIYIDANHTYESVKKDIISCLPKLKKGRFIAGHDYSESWPEVKKAVDEIFSKPDHVFEDESWIKFVE
jgi:hypothetical protein